MPARHKKLFKNLLKRHHFYGNSNCRRYFQYATAQEFDGHLFTCRANNHTELLYWFDELKLEFVRKKLGRKL